MNPEQTTIFLSLLDKIATALYSRQQYTLTGAQDWQMLLALFGVIVFLLAILIGMVGFMWKSSEAKQEKDVATIWGALEHCQADCCPRGAVKRDHGK